MPILHIANKNYSSWSLRPWILLKYFNVPFTENRIILDAADSKAKLRAISPTARVPVLEDGDVRVWESLAIMEYAADALAIPVWPADRAARAAARSLAAEMHAGFMGMRSAMPMNLSKKFAGFDPGERARADIARLSTLVDSTRRRFGEDGPFLFGAFSAADAMYLPLMTRLETYSVPLDGALAAYSEAMLSLPAYREWLSDAWNEPWLLADDEIDAEPIQVFGVAKT
ncbi:MAG: glutathione S-transferase family protein [Methylobacteriaceae bacterium]|nr:glutathione S-transferase family protein [Methylobacteriaceae bacterium]